MAPRLTSDDEARGLAWGLLGVAIFGLTLPFTRLAVVDLDPVFVALGRAVLAAVPAGALLWWIGAPLPPRALRGRMAIAALGVGQPGLRLGSGSI